MDCLRQVFVEQQYSLSRFHNAQARITARYEAILSEGSVPIIVDGGANIGASALWFAKEYPRATILAVEPDPNTFALLTENVGSGVIPLKAALGAEAGFVEVQVNTQAWMTRTVRAEEGLSVSTVQELLSIVPNGKLFIVKIDIEGFEKDLFASNTSWIEQAFVIYIEPHDWMLPGEATSRSFMLAIAPHDFEIYIAGENLTFVRSTSELR
jgi:FkbM family methyltransferase